jgi:hypothetical protein
MGGGRKKFREGGDGERGGRYSGDEGAIEDGGGEEAEKDGCGLGLRVRSTSNGWEIRGAAARRSASGSGAPGGSSSRASPRRRWKRLCLRLCISSRCGWLMLKRMGARTDVELEVAVGAGGREDSIGSGEEIVREGGDGERVKKLRGEGERERPRKFAGGERERERDRKRKMGEFRRREGEGLRPGGLAGEASGDVGE